MTPIGASVTELPRENLFRADPSPIEFRDAGEGGMPTLFGHFAVFNRWTEIDSWMEGRFLERLSPGAFKKTFRENRDRIRALFQHGRDPQIGDKPLGTIDQLREDETGGYYEVSLLDTSYNREIIPGLEAGLYGASFRFQVIREDMNEDPGAAEHNPQGLPERTIKEVRLHEFGPVSFPAYADATAGVRSLTDHFTFEDIARNPQKARDLILTAAAIERSATPEPADDAGEQDAPPQESAETAATTRSHPDPGRREPLFGIQGKEPPSWRL